MNPFNYRNGKLHCENAPVESITRRTGTPVYIYSKNKILTNLKNYDAAFAEMPRLLCYAVKANSNRAVLREIFKAGAGADVTSGGEIYRSLKAGVKPSKIVFAGIGKSAEEIEYAARSGILMFNSESLEEAAVINETGRRLGKRLNVSFRINPNVDPHTHAYITTGTEDNKFGIPIGSAVDAYISAGRMPFVKLVGLHCHIGSQIVSTAPFNLMARKIVRLAAELAKKGICLSNIDIGGGLGVKYNNETPPQPRDLAGAVLPIIKPWCETVVMEPGRYIVAEAGILAVKVLYRKNGSRKNFIVVDAGMTDLIRPTLYGAFHRIEPVKAGAHYKSLESSPAKGGAGGRSAGIPSDVVGPVCESGDFLGKNRRMPLPARGAYLAVMNAGAYGFAMSSQYNSRPRAAEVLVDGNKWRVIRRRETYKDLDISEK